MRNLSSIKYLLKPVLAILVVFFLFLCLPAQEQVYFNKRIDHYSNYDYSRNIIETDSGYMIGGFTNPENPDYEYFIHLAFTGITTEGEIYLFKEYGLDTISTFLGNPGSLIRYSEMKYLSVGTKRIYTEDWVHDQGMLACYNTSFDTLWTKLYGEDTLPYDTAFMLYQVKKNVQNSFIMTGLRLPIENPSSIWLMETDSLGNKLWETYIGDGVFYFQGHSIVQTSDGGYVIGGYKFRIGISEMSDPLIIKTDSLGNEEWRINPGNPDVGDNKVMLALASDGNIIAGTDYGTQQSGDNRWAVPKIMKITPTGEILWDYNYGEPGYDKILLNTTVLNNGSIITNGVITLFGEDDPWETSWILCVDSLGNELWYREYALLNGENSFNDLHHVIQTADNGLIGCGMVMPGLPYDTGTVDIWVMKMDSLGCVEAGCDTTVDVISYFESEASGFSIYPNPVSEAFTVALANESTQNYTLQIYDMYGTKVKKTKIPAGNLNIRVNSSGWQRGVYLAVLSSKNKTAISLKFVVQ